ncbi:putative Zn-finger protein [Azospirillum fermentarium]|uniref:zinc-finger domain-containing protein n=1 Tax=Azospirillum fermentarium TaxID=1233114 RepID=UPI0038739243|nr:putative Zn-finger protein [Azospirillum fermentarium]
MQPNDTTSTDIIEVETPTVGCDGGGGSLGHPTVYLTLEKSGRVECPYCSRVFTLKAGAAVGGHGH